MAAARMLFDAIGDDPELTKDLNPIIESLIKVIKGQSDRQKAMIRQAMSGRPVGLDRTPEDGGPESGTPLDSVTRLLTLAKNGR